MNFVSPGENTPSFHGASTSFSRHVKYFSVYLCRMDGESLPSTLLQRVRELLAQRPDVDEDQFFRAIRRTTPSWKSEFLSGKRTTKDLTVVIDIARFFRVPVGYLIGEQTPQQDAATVTLLGAWHALDSADQQVVLQLAVQLASRGRRER